MKLTQSPIDAPYAALLIAALSMNTTAVAFSSSIFPGIPERSAGNVLPDVDKSTTPRLLPA